MKMSFKKIKDPDKKKCSRNVLFMFVTMDVGYKYRAICAIHNQWPTHILKTFKNTELNLFSRNYDPQDICE